MDIEENHKLAMAHIRNVAADLSHEPEIQNALDECIDLFEAAPELYYSLKAFVNGLPYEVIDTHVQNLIDRAQRILNKAR